MYDEHYRWTYNRAHQIKQISEYAGLRDDPDCDHCGGGAETALHYLCTCTGHTAIRREIFGVSPINARKVIKSELDKIYYFAQGSGRFHMLGLNQTTSHTLNRPNGGDAGLNTANIWIEKKKDTLTF